METSKNLMDGPAKYGLKMRLNHEFPLQSKQIITPNTKQVFEMIPLTLRYLKYYIGCKMNHKKPIMDYFTMISAQRMYGCPIGGIGGGTIGRGFKGEFCRFQLCPGIYEYVTAPECQFIVNIRDADNKTIFQSVLSTYDKPKKAPASWEWKLNGADCEYTGLYPRAWTTYDLSEYGVKLICRQISPVIPHNYKDSSLPCAVFVWTAENTCNEHRTVSVTFTWAEVLPNKKKSPKLEIERYSEESTCGVTLEQKIGETPCTFTIAKTKQDNETIHDSYCMFNVAKDSNYVWECLKKHGKLEPENVQVNTLSNAKEKREDAQKEKHSHTKPNYKCDAVGLSNVLSLDPGGRDVMEFCLVWDMPIVKFKKDGKTFKRFYTKYFGSDGIAGISIASYALKNYKSWEKDLADWQDPILSNSNIPDWLKSALMNELYFVADGGTLWFDVQEDYPETDPRHHFGLFGYLEGHEYRMYNTYDVHFYASFALAQLWPNLQVVVQYMFRDTIALESKDTRKSLYNGKTVKTKVKDSIPHDLGDPAPRKPQQDLQSKPRNPDQISEDEPFVNINAYNIHDVGEWRDLNAKFILQVGRDYRLLRGHCAPFGDRYRSLQFIDNCCDAAADDLYARATHQYSEPPIPADPSPATLPSPAPVPAPAPPPPAGNILEMLYRNEDRTNEEEASSVGDGGGSVKGACPAAWDARQYLVDMYDACAALLRRTRQWDRDQDGLIENNGSPDQTFDAWVMSGPSAYCGGLWMAAVAVMHYLARQLSREKDELEFGQLLERAKASYQEKLWSGTHYRFDMTPANRRVIMADQLAGVWFLRASGITEQVVPDENVKTSLKTIYENNVLKFCEGKMGAVNGYMMGEKNEPGYIDRTALQSMEMWTGVTYGLAALMIYEGMYEEAFKTAGGMYSTLTQMGLSYETPEALYEDGNHRSVAYMRPLAVWAMYQAITARPPPPQHPKAIPNGKPQEVKAINNEL